MLDTIMPISDIKTCFSHLKSLADLHSSIEIEEHYFDYLSDFSLPNQMFSDLVGNDIGLTFYDYTKAYPLPSDESTPDESDWQIDVKSDYIRRLHKTGSEYFSVEAEGPFKIVFDNKIIAKGMFYLHFTDEEEETEYIVYDMSVDERAFDSVIEES